MAEPNDESPVVLHYTGDGTSYIPGVPQRDLTADDVKALPPDALREAMASDLYEPVVGARLPLRRSSVDEPNATTSTTTTSQPTKGGA